MGAREDNDRHTLIIRVGITPSRLISNPPSSTPIFTPDELRAATLPPNLYWLGIGTGICWIAYPVAWLNTPWLGIKTHLNNYTQTYNASTNVGIQL